MRFLIFLFALTFAAPVFAHGGIDFVVVSNTRSQGEGSLRSAIIQANEDEESQIAFQIPVRDPGFNRKTGVFTITLLQPLPEITARGTVVDGLAQTLINNSNKTGHEIRISGAKLPRVAGTSWSPGQVISAPSCQVKGITWSDFAGDGLVLTGEKTTNCRIQTNSFERIRGHAIVLSNGANGNWIGEAPEAEPFDDEFKGLYADEQGNEFLNSWGVGIEKWASGRAPIRVAGTDSQNNSLRGNLFYGLKKDAAPIEFSPAPKIAAPTLQSERIETPFGQKITVEWQGAPGQKVTLDLVRLEGEEFIPQRAEVSMESKEVQADENGLARWEIPKKGWPLGQWRAQASVEGASGPLSEMLVFPYLR